MIRYPISAALLGLMLILTGCSSSSAPDTARSPAKNAFAIRVRPATGVVIPEDVSVRLLIGCDWQQPYFERPVESGEMGKPLKIDIGWPDPDPRAKNSEVEQLTILALGEKNHQIVYTSGTSQCSANDFAAAKRFNLDLVPTIEMPRAMK